MRLVASRMAGLAARGPNSSKSVKVSSRYFFYISLNIQRMVLRMKNSFSSNSRSMVRLI